jgi:hypothetical protein
VTLAGTHAGEQAAAALVLAAAGRFAAGRSSRLAAGGLAALVAEQTSRSFLIIAHHGKTNRGHQHGDRQHHSTIHLKISSHMNEKTIDATLTVELSSVPLPPRRSVAAGPTLYGYSWIRFALES